MLPQAERAIDAAGEAFGPLGIIVAFLLLTIIGGQWQLYREKREEIAKLQQKHADDRADWQRRMDEAVKAEREMYRETVTSLNDVTGVLDTLRERVPPDLASQFGGVRDTINTRADRIEDRISNLRGGRRENGGT